MKPDGSASRRGLNRRLRQVLGDHTLPQVAAETGHHRETIRRYLAGQWPSASFLIQVCRAYEIDGHWLLTGESSARRDAPRADSARSSPAS